MGVLRRQYGYGNACYDGNNNSTSCNSSWYSWGRWVALGGIIVAAFLFFFLISRLSARRRKRLGRQPYYGTGWVGRTPFGHGQATYNPNVPQQEVPYGNGNTHTQQYNSPPSYGQQGQAAGYYGGENQGYFGGQQTGTEMQPPKPVYGSGTTYQPPSGPPPNKY